MIYREYIARIEPIYARYKKAASIGCKLTAAARVRDMAKAYAEYKGITYNEARNLFLEKLHHSDFIPT